MPRFRPARAAASQLVEFDSVRRLIGEVFRPAHFFIADTLPVTWTQHREEEVIWEVFQGRLLGPAQSRERRTFETWGLYVLGAAEPLLGLKLHAPTGELHVVRGLDCYVWEGYDAGGNVYLSRERRQWVRELVGTVRLEQFADLENLRDELIANLFHAVVGRRLPLSSVEAPLPAFSFGELLYVYRGPAAMEGPLRFGPEMVQALPWADLASSEQARALEALLRATPDATAILSTGADVFALLRMMFNEVSLSPYTDFAERTLRFLAVLEEMGSATSEQVIDFEGHLLRQLGRHLSGYDLVTFHHRGANYPDALLLDLVLTDYLERIERCAEAFADGPGSDVERRVKRLRRRALRQGWLVRRHYEGHPVPDLPTSPGENARVLPPSHPRVPEEQVLQPGRRRRRLYEGAVRLGPAGLATLRASALDLSHPEERRELGAALFLDRPFGIGKAPAEPDATLLLAGLAHSRSLAEQRLAVLAADIAEPDILRFRAEMNVPGLPLDAIGGAVKAATVSLADARRSAPDFVFLRTLPGSVRALTEQFDFAPIGGLPVCDHVLIARSVAGPGVVIYDAELRPRLELEVRTANGFASRAGQEWPTDGLLVVRVWEKESGEWRASEVRERGIVLPAKP